MAKVKIQGNASGTGVLTVTAPNTSTDRTITLPDATGELSDFAKKHNIPIIEDAAQGVAVKYKGNHVGLIGDIGVLSYYGNKTITTGEGGMILTNNEEFAKRCYRLKNHGRDKKGTFIHNHIGFNFSFTDEEGLYP